MQREHPDIPFERYADDAICHCRSEAQARKLRQALEQRFAGCRLRLHPEKAKIVYCRATASPRHGLRSADISRSITANVPHSSLDARTPDQAYFDALPLTVAA